MKPVGAAMYMCSLHMLNRVRGSQRIPTTLIRSHAHVEHSFLENVFGPVHNLTSDTGVLFAGHRQANFWVGSRFPLRHRSVFLLRVGEAPVWAVLAASPDFGLRFLALSLRLFVARFLASLSS